MVFFYFVQMPFHIYIAPARDTEAFIVKNSAVGTFQANSIKIGSSRANVDQSISTGILQNWAARGQTNGIKIGA